MIMASPKAMANRQRQLGRVDRPEALEGEQLFEIAVLEHQDDVEPEGSADAQEIHDHGLDGQDHRAGHRGRAR